MSNDRGLLAMITKGLGQLWRRRCCKALLLWPGVGLNAQVLPSPPNRRSSVGVCNQYTSFVLLVISELLIKMGTQLVTIQAHRSAGVSRAGLDDIWVSRITKVGVSST